MYVSGSKPEQTGIQPRLRMGTASFVLSVAKNEGDKEEQTGRDKKEWVKHLWSIKVPPGMPIMPCRKPVDPCTAPSLELGS